MKKIMSAPKKRAQYKPYERVKHCGVAVNSFEKIVYLEKWNDTKHVKR